MEWISKPVLRAVITIGIVAILFLLFWFAFDALLVIFAGILLAIFLRGLADLLSDHTCLSRGWSLAVVIVGIFLIISAAGYFLWPGVAAQIDQMIKILPGTVHYWISYLERYEWGRWILSEAPTVEHALLSRLNIHRLFLQFVDILAAIFIVVFIGIYLSAQSGLYVRGLVRLFPEDRREHAGGLFQTIGSTMRWWMAGRAIAMLAVGVLNWIGLSVIGVPLARTLALIAGLLTFIPYIGSILALVPTAMVALTVSPQLVLWAALVHSIAQSVEAYVVTPIAQRRAVELAPAVTITSQFLLGAWAGIPGLLFATPLAAIGLVLVNEMYLKRRAPL